MLAIESLGVGAQQPFHPFNQIRSRGLNDQMKMIAHQTIGVHLPSGLRTRRAEELEKTLSILSIPKNLLAPVAAFH
jgi:hypothetical protein